VGSGKWEVYSKLLGSVGAKNLSPSSGKIFRPLQEKSFALLRETFRPPQENLSPLLILQRSGLFSIAKTLLG